MKRTKIDWADSTWNPVTGCLHGCEYCYARGIARRFGNHMSEFRELENGTDEQIEFHVLDKPFELRRRGWINGVPVDLGTHGKSCPYPFDFEPTFHRYRLEEPAGWTKPRTIFVCSMADLFGNWVPDEWIAEVFNACAAAPQHRYLFLTKNPIRYPALAIKDILIDSDRFWYGSSTPRHNDPAFFSRPSPQSQGRYFRTFLSIEPMLERFGKCDERGSVAVTDWVIVGAETGNRKDKVIPQKEWIMELAEECDKRKKPIFMKESLRALMGSDFRQEFPWKD